MASPADVVATTFSQAQAYAASAQTSLTVFTNALNSSLYAPPTVSTTFATLAAPQLTPIGALPSLPVITFVAPTGQPSALTDVIPVITIDAFTESAPLLQFPVAPVVNYGVAPVIPAVGTVVVPSAPVLVLPNLPTYLTLSTPTFAGIDLRPDYLSRLENIPTLELVAPTPYSYSLGPQYVSTLLDTVKAQLLFRLKNGTGLAPAVEQGIWDRARSRETQLGLANQAEIMRNSEALGFQLPTGALAVQLREAQQDYYDKLSGLSRDVMIKQADMEQENLKTTIAQGMELEGKLVDYSYKMEQMTFETAKTAADNAIQRYNVQVDKYKALLSAYQTYATAYRAIIDGELAKVEVFKTLLVAEQNKASINNNLVLQYKTQIEAGMSQVEVFKAQVGGANALIQLEQTKISASGEQIRAYVAQVNAETSKVEAYKASVQGELGKVEVYKAKASAFGIVAGVQGERARAEISRFGALSQAKTAEWDGYRARVAGETARVQALGVSSSSLVDGFKAGANAAEAQGNINARMWESGIRQYEASQQIALSAAKINGDFAIQANNARMEAAKVGAQTYAQLTSSAYGMIHASTAVSAGSSMGVSYAYSNDTAGTAPTVTTI